ncbi:hypothetical protein ACMV8I_09400 [Ewingella sp. S1.OA.A_B6]
MKAAHIYRLTWRQQILTAGHALAGERENLTAEHGDRGVGVKFCRRTGRIIEKRSAPDRPVMKPSPPARR